MVLVVRVQSELLACGLSIAGALVKMTAGLPVLLAFALSIAGALVKIAAGLPVLV